MHWPETSTLGVTISCAYVPSPQEEQASLQEKLLALQKERKSLPYRPSGKAYVSGDEQSDEDDCADGGQESSTGNVVYSVSPSNNGAVSAVNPQGGAGSQNANKAPGSVRKKKAQPVVEKAVYIIGMPCLRQRAEKGSKDDTGPVKLVLTLPEKVSEQVMSPHPLQQVYRGGGGEVMGTPWSFLACRPLFASR